MSGLTTPLAGHGARTPTRRVRLALALLLLCQFVLLPPRVSHGAAPSALSFNGLNSYVSVADAPSLRIPVNMTVEAWIKPTAVSGHRHAVGKNDYELAVEPLGTGFMTLFEFASGGGWRSVTSGELALNQWYHVAGN